jgi:transcriptional regulator with XRE-family HTH domain
MDEPMSFGAWLRRCRGLLDMTQEAFAQQLGYAFHTYRKVENDEPPSKALVNRLADYLGVSAAERDALSHFAKTGAHPAPQAFLLRILSRTAQAPQPDTMSYLPLPPTRLIGRDAELAEVLEILQQLESGIVTLGTPPITSRSRKPPR